MVAAGVTLEDSDIARKRSSTRFAMLTERLAQVIGVIAIAIIGALRWTLIGTHVSGADWGNWLAIGRGMYGGFGRIAESVYPPLMPAIIHPLALTIGPLEAVRVMSVLSLVAVLASALAIFHGQMSPAIYVPLLVVIGLATSLNEPLMYGGYPQELATAFALIASVNLSWYLDSGRTKHLVVCCLSVAACSLTHHLVTPALAVAAGASWLLWLVAQPDRKITWNRTKLVLIPCSIGSVLFIMTIAAMVRAGFAPPLNVSDRSILESFRYATRESPSIWTALLAISLAFLLLRTDLLKVAIFRVGVALVLSGLFMLVVTKETRTLPLLQIGSVFIFAILLDDLARSVQRSWLTILPHIAALALPVLLWSRADATIQDYDRYYALLDNDFVAAVATVDSLDTQQMVAALPDRRGWGIGWIFSGLTDEPVAVGANEEWLGYPREKRLSAAVMALTKDSLSTTELATLARDAGFEYVVVKWPDWPHWARIIDLRPPEFTVIYRNAEFAILHVSSA